MTTAGEDLIRRMTAGDRDAFSRFYDRYSPLVFPLILKIVRDRADAADVLQDVFWEAWQGAGRYDSNRLACDRCASDRLQRRLLRCRQQFPGLHRWMS